MKTQIRGVKKALKTLLVANGERISRIIQRGAEYSIYVAVDGEWCPDVEVATVAVSCANGKHIIHMIERQIDQTDLVHETERTCEWNPTDAEKFIRWFQHRRCLIIK